LERNPNFRPVSAFQSFSVSAFQHFPKISMHDAIITHVENPGPLVLAARWRMAFAAAAGLGAATFALGLAMDPSRAWTDYLVAYLYFLFLGAGGLFFTTLHYAVNAQWVVVTRRISTGLAAYLPVAAVLLLGLFAGAGHIYPWTHDTHGFEPAKAAWLSSPLMLARDMVALLLWIFFGWKILIGLAVKQDQSGDPQLTRKAINWSIGFMPVFAISFTLISYDLVMSIEPHWYSTMFAVYTFAGMFQSTVATITIIFLLMKREDGPLAAVATPSHLKDLGTLLFAFTIFMAYIGFSQYMLIWYANLPEETYFFMKRQSGGWLWLFLALPVFKFVVPFFGLLSQQFKKTENWLMAVCAVVLVGQYLDLYWVLMPALHRTAVPIGWMEIGIFLGFAGLFGLAVTRFFTKYPVLAYRDPYVVESANWRFWE
jgi:hypothetical protein